MIHDQVIVKVNRPVDRGVRPLVIALSAFPQVVTCESCEGREHEQAYVSFHVGDSWEPLTEFIRRLSADLGKDSRLADTYYSLSVEWYAGGEEPLGYLRVPRQHIETVASAITDANSLGYVREP